MNNVRSVPSWYSPFLDGFSLEGESFSAQENHVGSSLPPRSSGLGGLPPRSPSGLGDVRPDRRPAVESASVTVWRRASTRSRPVSEVRHRGLRPVLTGVRLGSLPGRPRAHHPRLVFRGRTCVPRPAGLVQDAVAVLVKLGEQLNSLAGYRVLLVRPAAASPARWRGRAPFRPGLIAGALPTWNASRASRSSSSSSPSLFL